LETINPIIELYSKFLMAFISIVTPALTLYLNNYLIHRTKFEQMLKKRETDQQNLLDYFTVNIIQSNSDINNSNETIKKMKTQTDSWLVVVERLNPLSFFKSNILLLSLSLFFLFAWLFVRTGKWIEPPSECYMTLQILVGITSLGCCLLHIYNLISMGVFLISARPIVDEINEEIAKVKAGHKTSARQVIKK
jgi:hypothetical protein